MASIVEKYEQIFASDPKSRIFVELARALLDRGEADRAIDVCSLGLEHHPSSILGRVIWGRALLERGERKLALDQFEISIALDPASPYAYNLVGEALLAKGMARAALPVLARACELQPSDERVKTWYAEAKRLARAENPPHQAASPRAEEKTEPYRAIPEEAGTPAPVPGDDGPVIADDPFALGASAPEPSQAVPPRLPRAPPPGSAEATPPPKGPGEPDGTEATTQRDLAPVTRAPPAAPPPLEGPPAPPPLPARRSILDLIPDGAFRPAPRMTGIHKPPPMPEVRQAQAAEAERIAARYAEEIRQKMLAAEAPHSAAAGRGRLMMGAVVVLAVLAAAGVWLAVSSARSAELSRTALTRARAGLARDTVGALREASALLAQARERSPDDPGLLSLSAQVAALLGVEHGDVPALALARELVAAGTAGDGAVAARYVLAQGGSERTQAEAALLEARPSGPPLLQTLAGELLLSRGELDAGRGRLEIAARASPPTLRALSALGDAALAGGDAEAALEFFLPALAAHGTHPRSVIGAAEARLALGRDLDLALKALEAVEADPASAPPVPLRPRFEAAFARLLSALGQPQTAAQRLASVMQARGESPVLVSTLAEVHLASRAWDRAEAAAQRAVTLAPKDPAARVLLARARLGRGRPAEALKALAGREERPARIQRAIALLRLGRAGEARSELEKTVRDGRMPSEAAVWYALTDVALGRADRARPLLERLASAATPAPMSAVALGRACEALSDLACAEKAYRDAVKREPRAPEGHAALGRLLAAKGDLPGALAELGEAVKLEPSDLDARRALGEVRLASGQPGAARAELDAVLLAYPKDASALVLVSAAWLAEGKPAEARRAAERAVAAAPGNAAAMLGLARASLAAGDKAAARSWAGKALRAGAPAEDATKVLLDAGGKPPAAKGGKKKR